tara:strand:- start:155 stop:313 length:159 start_codon:yes stop_codon:yes gene_type:complete
MTFLPRRSIRAFTVRHTHAGVADRFFTWSFHDDEKKSFAMRMRLGESYRIIH